MTREEIMAASNEELDVMVAGHVMGWQWTSYPWYDGTTKQLLTREGKVHSGDDFNYLEGDRILPWDMPIYSESFPDAWEVFKTVEKQLFSKRRKFLDELQNLTRTPDGDKIAWPDVLWHLTADKICRAALLAKIEEGKA